MGHAFYPGTWRQRQADLCKLRPAWTTELVPGHPRPHRETPSFKKKKKNEAREMAQGLEVKSTDCLPEVLISIPSNHKVAHNHPS